jgi:hypothetical protein
MKDFSLISVGHVNTRDIKHVRTYWNTFPYEVRQRTTPQTHHPALKTRLYKSECISTISRLFKGFFLFRFGSLFKSLWLKKIKGEPNGWTPSPTKICDIKKINSKQIKMPVGIRLCRYARNEWMTQIFEKKRRVLQMTNASSHNLTKSRPDFQRVASLVWSQVLALRDVPPQYRQHTHQFRTHHARFSVDLFERRQKSNESCHPSWLRFLLFLTHLPAQLRGPLFISFFGGKKTKKQRKRDGDTIAKSWSLSLETAG